MFTSIIHILSKAPRSFWVILAFAFLGCSLTISAGVFMVLVRAGSLEYKGSEIEFSLDRANAIAENSDVLTEKVSDLEQKIKELKAAPSKQQTQNAIAEIDNAIAEIKPTVEKVSSDSKELVSSETE